MKGRVEPGKAKLGSSEASRNGLKQSAGLGKRSPEARCLRVGDPGHPASGLSPQCGVPDAPLRLLRSAYVRLMCDCGPRNRQVPQTTKLMIACNLRAAELSQIATATLSKTVSTGLRIDAYAPEREDRARPHHGATQESIEEKAGLAQSRLL